MNVRYYLADENGEPCLRYHQDDELDILYADSPTELINLCADRLFNMSTGDFIEEMRNGEYTNYKIMRETYESEESNRDEALKDALKIWEDTNDA